MKKYILSLLIAVVSAPIVFAQVSTGYTTLGFSSECVDLTYTLRLGSRDVTTEYEVSVLQDFLSPAYLYLPVGPTGYFGQSTMRAVKSFQRDYGISPTGQVGPQTRAKVRELTCGGGGYGICAKDLKVCPNGVVVERTGAQCQFVCPSTVSPSQPITGVCTMDAKVCPNGSTVGRVGPYCDFAPCPTSTAMQTPVIYSLSSNQVRPGDTVIIQGIGFISSQTTVYLNSYPVSQSYTTNQNSITFTVPFNTTPGTYSVKVSTMYGTSNTVSLAVVSSPVYNPTVPTAPTSFSSSVSSGQAPLSVQFYADRTTTLCEGNVPYRIDFGDGSQATMDVNGINYTTSWNAGGGTPCAGYFKAHTYTSAGTYIARLYKTISNSCIPTYGTVCPLFASREEQVGSITIQVSQLSQQIPVIASVQSVRTGTAGVVYVGEEARITGSNLNLVFPPSGIGARLDVNIGGFTVTPFNVSNNSLSFIVPSIPAGPSVVTVTNSYGVSNSFSVTVLSPNTSAPMVNFFTANPDSVQSGRMTTLSWSTTNTTNCLLNGAYVPTSGSQSVQGGKHTLVCVGLNGTITREIEIPVYVVDPIMCATGYVSVNGVCVPQVTPQPNP